MLRPSRFDIKYQHMNQEETALNYDRDVMLWEQTEAIKQLQEANKKAEINHMISNRPDPYPNCFDNMLKYNPKIYDEYLKLDDQRYNIKQTPIPFIQTQDKIEFSFVVSILFGIPALIFLHITQNDKSVLNMIIQIYEI